MNEQTSSAAVVQQFGLWLQQWAAFTMAQAGLAGSADPDNDLPDAGTADPPPHWLADRGEVDGPPEHWLALLQEHNAEWLLDVAGESRSSQSDPNQLAEGEEVAFLPPKEWLPDLRQGFLYFLEAFGVAPPDETGGAERIGDEKYDEQTAEPLFHPHPEQPQHARRTNEPESTKAAMTAEPQPPTPSEHSPQVILREQTAIGDETQPDETALDEKPPARQPIPASPPITAAPPDIIQTWRLPEQEPAPPSQVSLGSDKVEPAPVDQIEEQKFTPPDPEAEQPGTASRQAAPEKRPVQPTSVPLKLAEPPLYQPAEAATAPPPPTAPPDITESVQVKRPQPARSTISPVEQLPAPPTQPADQETAVGNEGQRQSENAPTPVKSQHLVEAVQKKMEHPVVTAPEAPPPVVHVPPLPPQPVPETQVQLAEPVKQRAVRPQEQTQDVQEPVVPVEKTPVAAAAPNIIQRKTVEPTTTAPQPRRVTRLRLRYSPPQRPTERPRPADTLAEPTAQAPPQRPQAPQLFESEPSQVERQSSEVPMESDYRGPKPRPAEKQARREPVIQLKGPEAGERLQTKRSRNKRPKPDQLPPQSTMPEKPSQTPEDTGGRRPFWLWEIAGSERPQPAGKPKKESNGSLEIQVGEVPPFQKSGTSTETKPPQSSKQEPWPELPTPPKLTNPGRSRRHDSGRRRRLDSEQRGRRWNG